MHFYVIIYIHDIRDISSGLFFLLIPDWRFGLFLTWFRIKIIRRDFVSDCTRFFCHGLTLLNIKSEDTMACCAQQIMYRMTKGIRFLL